VHVEESLEVSRASHIAYKEVGVVVGSKTESASRCLNSNVVSEEVQRRNYRLSHKSNGV
jgi:hypothetical protein